MTEKDALYPVPVLVGPLQRGKRSQAFNSYKKFSSRGLTKEQGHLLEGESKLTL